MLNICVKLHLYPYWHKGRIYSTRILREREGRAMWTQVPYRFRAVAYTDTRISTYGFYMLKNALLWLDQYARWVVYEVQDDGTEKELARWWE